MSAEDPRKARRRLDPAARRAEIAAAARELFGTRGYSGTSHSAVAQAAGASEALVHGYFPNKDALFAAAIHDPLIAALRDLQTFAAELLTDQQDHLPRRLRDLLERTLEKIAELAPLFSAADLAHTHGHYDIEQVAALRRSSAETLRTVLAHHGCPPVPTAVVVSALYDVWFGPYVNARQRGYSLDTTTTSRQLAALLTHGLNGGSPT